MQLIFNLLLGLGTLLHGAPAEATAPLASAPSAPTAVLEDAASLSDWGPWNEVRDYPGLKCRVRRGSYNEDARKHVWHVEFRNDYISTIEFSYTATPRGTKGARTDHLKSLAPGDKGSMWFLIADDDGIWVFVDKVKFGG